jgi:hypothetical protein
MNKHEDIIFLESLNDNLNNYEEVYQSILDDPIIRQEAQDWDFVITNYSKEIQDLYEVWTSFVDVQFDLPEDLVQTYYEIFGVVLFVTLKQEETK